MRPTVIAAAAAAWTVAVAGAVVAIRADAVLTSQAPTGSSPFTTAKRFCPTTAPAAVEFLDGFELGRVFGATATGAFFSGANTANVTADTNVVRNGTYSMKVVANGVATNAQRILISATNTATVRFAVALANLPASDVELARIGPTTGATLQLLYHAATQRLALSFTGGTSVDASSTVTAGTWMVVDLKIDQSTATYAGSWSVDGVAQTGRTAAGTATSVYSLWLGTTLANTYTANFDDLVLSDSGSDYPFGNGKVLGLEPTGMGTHNTAADFLNDDGTAINSTSYTRVDDLPMVSSTDYIKQVTASATAYIELTFQPTTEKCVRAVQGDLLHDTLNSNQANNGKAVVYDGTAERVVFSGQMSSSSATQFVREGIVTPPAAPWTTAQMNALKGRLGYSTDASPAPRWDAFMLEYEVFVP